MLHWLHYPLNFSLLRSSIQALHRARSSRGPAVRTSTPMDLITTESHIVTEHSHWITFVTFVLHSLQTFRTEQRKIIRQGLASFVCFIHAKYKSLLCVIIQDSDAHALTGEKKYSGRSRMISKLYHSIIQIFIGFHLKSKSKASLRGLSQKKMTTVSVIVTLRLKPPPSLASHF